MIASATAGWRAEVAIANTLRSWGSGPPSQWPTARPTAANAAIATRLKLPIMRMMSGHSLSRIGTHPAASTTVAVIDSGLSSHRASAGATFLTAMPARTGNSIEVATIFATLSADTSTARWKMSPNSAAASGT